jgi:predicted RNA polymerase sigma factor
MHHVRDATFREDLHQARTGNGPAVLVTLDNSAIGYHRTTGATKIARATRRVNRRPHDLITAVTSGYPRTHLLWAVAGDLLCRSGAHQQAREHLLRAAAITRNSVERTTMQGRAAHWAARHATSP